MKNLREVKDDLLKWGGFNAPTYFTGIESLQNSDRIYLNLRQKIESCKNPFIIIDESLKIKNIEAKSFEELDKISSTWQDDIGSEVKYVTFEHMSKGMFRVYPKVDGAINNIEQTSLYGGLIDITIGDDDYQIPSILNVEENLDQYIVMYIVKKPLVVTIESIDLEIEPEWDKALEKYIAHRCLQSDTDAINRQYSLELLQQYTAYVSSATQSETLSNNRINNLIVPYRGGFQ